MLGASNTASVVLINTSTREQRWNAKKESGGAIEKHNLKTHKDKSHSKGSKRSGSHRKFENLDKIETIVNESYCKLSHHGDEEFINHNNTTIHPTAVDSSVDIGLWKNMIFYKSIAHVAQQRKKQEIIKDKIAVNHYANVPSKIRAYIRRPIDG